MKGHHPVSTLVDAKPTLSSKCMSDRLQLADRLWLSMAAQRPLPPVSAKLSMEFPSGWRSTIPKEALVAAWDEWDGYACLVYSATFRTRYSTVL